MLDTQIVSVEEAEKILSEEKATIVYFTSPKCNVCKSLRPKVMELMKNEFPDMGRYFVDASVSEDVSAKFTVFAVPTILVFLEGREFARESRNMSPMGLVEKIRRPYEIMNS
jgi:thioredoxin 1